MIQINPIEQQNKMNKIYFSLRNTYDIFYEIAWNAC